MKLIENGGKEIILTSNRNFIHFFNVKTFYALNIGLLENIAAEIFLFSYLIIMRKFKTN